MSRPSKQSLAAKKADLHEITLLRQKVTDLVLQHPQKAAKILELWLKGIHSRQKTGAKKAA